MGIDASFSTFVNVARKGSGSITINDNELTTATRVQNLGKKMGLVANRTPADKDQALAAFSAALTEKLESIGYEKGSAIELTNLLLSGCMEENDGQGSIKCSTVLKINELIESSNLDTLFLASDLSGLSKRSSFRLLLKKEQTTAFESLENFLKNPKKMASMLPVVGTGVKIASALSCANKAGKLGALYENLVAESEGKELTDSQRLTTEVLKIAQNHYIMKALKKAITSATGAVTSATTGLDGFGLVIDPAVDALLAEQAEKLADKTAVKASETGVIEAGKKLTKKSVVAANIPLGSDVRDNLGDFRAIRAFLTYLSMGDRSEAITSTDKDDSTKQELLEAEQKRMELRVSLFPESDFDSLTFGAKTDESQAESTDLLQQLFTIICTKTL